MIELCLCCFEISFLVVRHNHTVILLSCFVSCLLYFHTNYYVVNVLYTCKDKVISMLCF